MVSKQVAAIFTILGGVFYLIASFVVAILFGVVLLGIAKGLSDFNNSRAYSIPAPTGLDPAGVLLSLGAFSGVLIIAGGALLNSDQPQRRKIGGALAIVMMIIGAIPTIGGFGLGFILTLIGVVIGLTYKENSPDIVIGVNRTSSNELTPMTTSGRPKYCIKCGTPLHEGAVYCGACGAAVP